MAEGSTPVKLAQPVPLRWKLVCPDSLTYYVRATIRKPDGTLLTTKDLTEIANDEHVNNDFMMPNDNYIRATYKAYTDAGYTNEADVEEVWDNFHLAAGEGITLLSDEFIELESKQEESILVSTSRNTNLPV